MNFVSKHILGNNDPFVNYRILCRRSLSSGLRRPGKYLSPTQLVNTRFGHLGLCTIVATVIWLAPALILIPFDFRSIEYSVKAASSEGHARNLLEEGIMTITRKHPLFRTSTNISSKAGPYDWLFKMGSVHIETEGYSGTQQAGREEKLQRTIFHDEGGDFILNELCRFRDRM